MPRITRIYTRSGDDGSTGLGGGQRVPKDALRIDAYGTVDELNSVIGVARSVGLDPELESALATIQQDLFDLGSDLCMLEEDKKKWPVPQIEAPAIEQMERWMDGWTDQLGPLENFILPAGSPGAAQLHVARTVCRRAERCLVALQREETVRKEALRYLNRLSDLLFTMARWENRSKGVEDVYWDSRRGKS